MQESLRRHGTGRHGARSRRRLGRGSGEGWTQPGWGPDGGPGTPRRRGRGRLGARRPLPASPPPAVQSRGSGRGRVSRLTAPLSEDSLRGGAAWGWETFTEQSRRFSSAWSFLLLPPPMLAGPPAWQPRKRRGNRWREGTLRTARGDKEDARGAGRAAGEAAAAQVRRGYMRVAAEAKRRAGGARPPGGGAWRAGLAGGGAGRALACGQALGRCGSAGAVEVCGKTEPSAAGAGQRH